MSQHTPGPWTSEYREGRAAAQYGHHVHSNVYSRPGVSDGRDAIAEVRGESDEVARANARLIAAAPEMYAFIKHLFDAGIILPTESVGKDARALLARIEGR